MPEDVAAWLKPDAAIRSVGWTEDKSDGDRGGRRRQTRIAAVEEDGGSGKGRQRRTKAEDVGGGRRWRMKAEDEGGG